MIILYKYIDLTAIVAKNVNKLFLNMYFEIVYNLSEDIIF